MDSVNIDITLFIIIFVTILVFWVLVLFHYKPKSKKIPQRVMAFGISFIFFIYMDEGFIVAHGAGPEDNHPRNPPLLKDGSTAPELSLRPPTSTNEASTSTGPRYWNGMNPFLRYFRELEDERAEKHYIENYATDEEKKAYEEKLRVKQEEEKRRDEAERKAKSEYNKRRYQLLKENKK